MNDPRFQSVHLAALPRRDEYRRARSRLEEACGEYTIAGGLRLAEVMIAPDAPTLAPDAKLAAEGSEVVCFLRDAGRVIPLRIGLNSIGRLPDNDIVIDDASVSRRHCAVLVHSDLSCELHDTASKNGTTINGRKLSGPTCLKDGDEICLCERKIKFCRGCDLPQDKAPKKPQSNSDQTMISMG